MSYADEWEELLIAMATAGQELAVRWGHEPWSDSWARQVATAMLNVTLDHATAA